PARRLGSAWTAAHGWLSDADLALLLDVRIDRSGRCTAEGALSGDRRTGGGLPGPCPPGAQGGGLPPLGQRMTAPPPRPVAPLVRQAQRRRLLTPVRVAMIVAVIGSGLLIVFGIVDRTATQIPILASGLAVLGL